MPRKTAPQSRLGFRNRIIGLKQVKASELLAHERNWRTHTDQQAAAMRGILNEVGWVDGVIARQLPDGSLQLVNGHLRRDISGDDLVPVLITDLTEDEAEKVLLTFDPLTGMARADSAMFAELLKDVEVTDESLRLMLGDEAAKAELFKLAQGEDSQVTEWKGMPECESDDQQVFRTIKIHFKDQDAVDQFWKHFRKVVKDQTLTEKTQYLWFPQHDIDEVAHLRYKAADQDA